MIVNFKSRTFHYFQKWAKLAREFKALWKNYPYQSFLAAIVVSIIFWVLSAEEAVIVASIGSKAFIVFTMPSYPTAKSRRVIGGHVVGFLCSVIGAVVLRSLEISPIVIYSLVVDISIFLMVVLDVEHAPASGTALGVVISGYFFKVMLAVLTSTLILSLAHHYLKRYLRDLVYFIQAQ
jgi:CBS-domain-containing membrane protein